MYEITFRLDIPLDSLDKHPLMQSAVENALGDAISESWSDMDLDTAFDNRAAIKEAVAAVHDADDLEALLEPQSLQCYRVHDDETDSVWVFDIYGDGAYLVEAGGDGSDHDPSSIPDRIEQHLADAGFSYMGPT